jgi:hypothetical protein
MLVENLLNNYYSYERRLEEQDFPGGLTEENCRKGMENHAELLDKLSPNWREADSCAEIETYPVAVENTSVEEGAQQ